MKISFNTMLKSRFWIFIFFLLLFISSHKYCVGTFLPSDETKDLWFYSGLFMLYFSILFIEPYYTSPKNIITNVIPLLLVFIPIKGSFNPQTVWWWVFSFLSALLAISMLAMLLEDRNESPKSSRNKISLFLTKIASFLGRARVIYSLMFILFLLLYSKLPNTYFLILFIFWFVIISIDPNKTYNTIFPSRQEIKKEQIGTIFGVQSKKIFLVKLFEDRKGIRKFDLVKFKYLMEDQDGYIITGIVFDTYLLNQEKWAKILEFKKQQQDKDVLDSNVVYLISAGPVIEQIREELKINDFVGVITDESDIGKIRFEYSKETDNLQEGELLFVEINKKKIFYQVINGTTRTEGLEARNETGFIEGEAVQIGEWEEGKKSFKKYGWVPTVNTLVFKAKEDSARYACAYPEYYLGNVPSTNFPSIINIKDMISHHIAILGITGSGKTYISQKIIEEAMRENKIICIDFTGEYIKKLSTLNPKPIINNPEGLKKVEESLAAKETATQRKNSEQVLKYKQEISDKIKEYIDAFMGLEGNLGVLELPELSNTTFILEFTQFFIDSVFKYAKQQYSGNATSKAILIVLEEAHTLIPETNFLGEMGDFNANKALVNKIGQIALQGRKYGVGFMVIAQRTANVSKTVLTQCNTVICFQAFDETSFSFLSNYLGKDMVKVLPNLKQYNAIVAGKAIKSSVPMIIDLTRKQ